MTSETNQPEQRDLVSRLRQRRESGRDLIPTPWPGLTELAELTYRHRVGIIAQRGSREAKVGRDVAVHAAKAGVPTVLYTGYPPTTVPPLLVVDDAASPTPEQVAGRIQIGRAHV